MYNWLAQSEITLLSAAQTTIPVMPVMRYCVTFVLRTMCQCKFVLLMFHFTTTFLSYVITFVSQYFKCKYAHFVIAANLDILPCSYVLQLTNGHNCTTILCCNIRSYRYTHTMCGNKSFTLQSTLECCDKAHKQFLCV
jgi:hypothetical protein